MAPLRLAVWAAVAMIESWFPRLASCRGMIIDFAILFDQQATSSMQLEEVFHVPRLAVG